MVIKELKDLKTPELIIACMLWERDHIGHMVVHFGMALQRGEAKEYMEDAREMVRMLKEGGFIRGD